MNSKSMQLQGQEKPTYGIDAPPVIGTLFLLGALMVAVSVWLGSTPWLVIPLSIATWSIATAVLFVTYALIGKFRYRDIMLAMVNWTGRESVLDVGTGRGFLLVGAAKKLTTGKAYGIDIWSQGDLTRNAPENTLRNLELEGVISCASIKSEDARCLSFPDETFDVVVSNLCLHNISEDAGREQACVEIARVLKKGGVALISDFKYTRAYARVFRSKGLSVRIERRYWLSVLAPLPLRVVRAEKK